MPFKALWFAKAKKYRFHLFWGVIIAVRRVPQVAQTRRQFVAVAYRQYNENMALPQHLRPAQGNASSLCYAEQVIKDGIFYARLSWCRLSKEKKEKIMKRADKASHRC